MANLLYNQVLVNNGGSINALQGSYIYVNGSVENAASGQMNIDEMAGIPAEMYITGNITNNAILSANGHIRLLGNWYNNSVFSSATGTVFFEGANQILGGSVSSEFYNLTLDGSGLKTQTIDQYANGVLDLKHLELQTETHAFYMQNTNPNSIIRTSGFVSSLNGGYLSRNTLSATSYLFPVGSSVGMLRYRPVALTPLGAQATTYTVRLANVNATSEGQSTTSLDTDICEVNPLFYHQIDRTSGTMAADFDIFYDETADGLWHGISKWELPGDYWNSIAASFVSSGVPLSTATANGWNDFSTRPYILHRVNVAPVFDNYGPYCVGEVPPALPGTSINGIAGTWNPAAINTSSAGTTEYTFTPSMGACGFVYTMDVTVNPLPVIELGSDVNVCENNVPVTLDAGAGMSSYLWSTGAFTQTIQVSTTDTYSVTVSNSFGCTADDAVSLTVHALPVVGISGLASQYCANAGVEVLTGNPAGGTFSGPGISGNSFNPAVAGVGNHTIEYVYTDVFGCSNSTTQVTEVTSLPQLSTASVISPGCNGSSDGSISLSVSGGTPGYNYIWDPSTGTNGPTATNLTAGTYHITVEDSYGCSNNILVVLTEPAGMNVAISINNQVSCNGNNDGSVATTVTGGTSPYSYTWNYDNSHQSYHNGLPAGTWTVLVEDANGCTESAQVTITQPDILDVQFINVQHVSCFGMADGAAIAQPVGGTGPYTYLWSNPGMTTQPTLSNVPMGTYHVTITDANGCSVTDFIHITQPDPLEVTTTSQPVVCGINLGSVSATVSGGSLPYSYQWTGGQSGPQVPGLLAGTYGVTVTDGNGCTATSVVYVSMQGNGVVHITETQPITCHGEANAILTAEMINGVSPISYQWSNSATGATIQNLAAGVYSVTVNDAWGCSGMQSYMVTEPSEIILVTTTTPVSCYGGNNGTATVQASGGHSPYTYFWSNGGNAAGISNLVAGSYVVTVTDAYQCSKVGNVVVIQPESPVSLNMTVSHISCYGMHDGSVSLNVTGGTSPYSYNWELGSYSTTEANISNLYEGIYNLTVTDANNCELDTIAIVSQPAPLTATYVGEGPSCIGNTDGSIHVIASGGTSPYSYAWSQGISPIEYIDGLVEGEYMITVVDDRGCETEIGPVVLWDYPEECLRIPNAFTPNGDGINDTWIIDNIWMYPAAYIQVYNRWGQALYEAKGSEEPWDGTYNGKPVPAGPYIYIVNLLNGEPAKTGIVTVVR